MTTPLMTRSECTLGRVPELYPSLEKVNLLGNSGSDEALERLDIQLMKVVIINDL